MLQCRGPRSKDTKMKGSAQIVERRLHLIVLLPGSWAHLGMGAGGGARQGGLERSAHSCAAQAHQIRASRDKRNRRFLISTSQYPRMSTSCQAYQAASQVIKKGRSIRATMWEGVGDDLNVTLSSTRQPYLTYQRNHCGRAADGPLWEIFQVVCCVRILDRTGYSSRWVVYSGPAMVVHTTSTRRPQARRKSKHIG